KPQYGLTKEQGTSFSAPAITASLAVLKERFDYLTATQIRDTLLTTATDLGEKGVDNVYGWGLINLKKAVNGPTQFLNDETI
ncbi:S8 family serine peptidase, partial [Mannheimia haemolytica]